MTLSLLFCYLNVSEDPDTYSASLARKQHLVSSYRMFSACKRCFTRIRYD